MEIRQYKNSDSDEIWLLFYSTVHSINAKDYIPEQLDAWANADTHILVWTKKNLGVYTIVGIDSGKIVGFGDIDESGYIDHLFVGKDSISKGIGAAIYDELEKRFKAKEFTAYASITARPFFEKRGFRVIRENEVERHGVILKNYFIAKGK